MLGNRTWGKCIIQPQWQKCWDIEEIQKSTYILKPYINNKHCISAQSVTFYGVTNNLSFWGDSSTFQRSWVSAAKESRRSARTHCWRKLKLSTKTLAQFYTVTIELILTSSITAWFAEATAARDRLRLCVLLWRWSAAAFHLLRTCLSLGVWGSAGLITAACITMRRKN